MLPYFLFFFSIIIKSYLIVVLNYTSFTISKSDYLFIGWVLFLSFVFVINCPFFIGQQNKLLNSLEQEKDQLPLNLLVKKQFCEVFAVVFPKLKTKV